MGGMEPRSVDATWSWHRPRCFGHARRLHISVVTTEFQATKEPPSLPDHWPEARASVDCNNGHVNTGTSDVRGVPLDPISGVGAGKGTRTGPADFEFKGSWKDHFDML